MNNFYKVSFVILLSLFFFSLPSALPPVLANQGCAVTKVGNPTGPTPTFPPDCTFTGGELPADTQCIPVGAENSNGIAGKYCLLSPAVANTVHSVFYNEPGAAKLYEKRIQSSKWQDWGSEEMIKVIYEVAKVWGKGSPAIANRAAIPAHPNGWVIVQDISSDYHSEHHCAVA